MPRSSFQHVSTWVFDLDNTLYPPAARLFDQIQTRMTDWVMARLNVTRDHADGLRDHYWKLYGTTLAGLMHEHQVEPEAYLADVHDIDFSALTPDPALADAIRALPGRRIVFTNADTFYAGKVLEKRGLGGIFDAVYGVGDTGYRPKPERAAFEAVFALDGLDPRRAAMFEDDPRNLAVPHQMGMRTVHVAPEPATGAHIHHYTDDLTGFLARLG
ncbi:pyrimidine 5'-nucleotidase [Pseudogemmobacter sonorensis]|uniref:pyrimidine 5'-nucleotidase n=1 Tax=Pseudogemmobacter sonorensis TaxID=2989681 RepID=UPI0036B424EE